MSRNKPSINVCNDNNNYYHDIYYYIIIIIIISQELIFIQSREYIQMWASQCTHKKITFETVLKD